jgi:hypothetical protein
LFLRSKSFSPEGRDLLANAKIMADMATPLVYVATKLPKKSKSRSTDDGAKGGKKL